MLSPRDKPFMRFLMLSGAPLQSSLLMPIMKWSPARSMVTLLQSFLPEGGVAGSSVMGVLEVEGTVSVVCADRELIKETAKTRNNNFFIMRLILSVQNNGKYFNEALNCRV